MDPAFTICGLTKICGDGPAVVRALSGIDLDIAEGELLILLGPSGSGKSTLLNILGGLDRASEGQVRFRDMSLTAMDKHALANFRRKHVGFTFQF